MEVLLLREADIRELVGPSEALRESRAAFAKLGRGEVHAKGAYLRGTPYFSIKVASGFSGNPERGLPVGAGAVWVFDATTGLLAAMLLDNGYLTELRTGAAGALSIDLLARSSVRQVGIVGCGVQARYQLQALMGVRRPERVLVFCRTEGSAAAFAAEMEFSLGVSVRAAGSAREAVEEADIVVTTTTSRGPVVFDGWIRPGTHIAAIGSDVPEKQELDPALLGRAKIVADRLAQCVTQGEIHHAIEARSITVDQVYAELGEIAAGLKPGRQTDKEIT